MSGIDRFGRVRGRGEINETYIESIARDSREKAEIGRARARRKWRLKLDYLESTHKYRLHHGDTPIGPVVQMTGLEAVTRNKAFETAFIRALDANAKAPRMSRWILAERLPSPRERWVDGPRAAGARDNSDSDAGEKG